MSIDEQVFADVTDDVSEIPQPSSDGMGGETEYTDTDNTQSAGDETPSGDSFADPDDSGVEEPQLETAPTDELDGFNPSHLSQVGLTAEQAKERFGDPATFEQAVNDLNQKYLEAGRRANPQQRQQQEQPDDVFSFDPSRSPQQLPPPPASQQQQQRQQPPAPPANDQQKATPEQGEAWKKFRANVEVNPDDYDEETAELLNTLNDHYAKQLHEVSQRKDPEFDQIKDAVRIMAEDRARQNEEVYFDKLDGLFDALPEEHQKVFGVGSHRSLDAQFMRERAEVEATLLDLQRGRMVANQPPLPIEQALEMAISIKHPNIQKAIVKNEVVGKTRNRLGQFTARPSKRKQTNQTSGKEAAGSFAREFFQDRGFQTDEYEADDEI